MAIVFVVGPISYVNKAIAAEISRWVGWPRCFIKDILGGLRTPLVDTERSSSSSAAAAGQVVDDFVANNDQLACMALRILFAQAESVLLEDWIADDGFVLEFTTGPKELPTVSTLFEVMKKKIKTVDRGLIIHYPLPSDRYGISDYHSYADVREAIHRQLLCSLSLSSDEQQEQLQLEESSFINHRRVLKLEIDPNYDFNRIWERSKPRSSGEPPSNPFYQAIEYMLFEHNLEEEEVVPLSITMRQWPKIRLDLHRRRYGHGLPTDWSQTSLCFMGSDDHYIILITSNNEEDKCNNNAAARMCRLCDKPVAADPAANFDSTSHDVGVYYYSCAFCPLYLHKHCAELKDQDSFSPLPSGYSWLGQVVKHTCKYHQDAGGKDFFSRRCKACLFDTVLKSRKRPTVISHPFFHQLDNYPFLQIRVSTAYEECAACGYIIQSSYSYISLRNNLLHGFSCLTQLPLEEKEQTHFGHRHPLKLMSKPHQKLDYYLCHVCYEERRERHWYYFCEECEYSAHVRCIHPQLYRSEHIDDYH